MNKSDQINELAAALSKVQATMGAATKDSANPFFRSKYADLGAVWEVAREPLAANGLSIAQVSKIADPLFFQATDKNGAETTVMQLGVIVETVLMHSSGQWISGECYYPLAKADPQGVGSAITYGRRYGMKAMLGVVDQDDDGNIASGNRGEPPDQNQPTNRQQVGQAAKQTAARQKAATGNVTPMPTHSGPPQDQSPEAKYKADMDYYFGTSGPAFKQAEKIMGLCKKLNESGHATKWSFKALAEHVQEGFDKAIAQLDEGEVNVLVEDLTGVYDEWMAIKHEGESVKTPTGKKAPAPKGKIQPADDDPATPDQIGALQKMCEIKTVTEIEIMLKEFPDGSKTNFEQLTFGEGKKALTTIAAWAG